MDRSRASHDGITEAPRAGRLGGGGIGGELRPLEVPRVAIAGVSCTGAGRLRGMDDGVTNGGAGSGDAATVVAAVSLVAEAPVAGVTRLTTGGGGTPEVAGTLMDDTTGELIDPVEMVGEAGVRAGTSAGPVGGTDSARRRFLRVALLIPDSIETRDSELRFDAKIVTQHN